MIYRHRVSFRLFQGRRCFLFPLTIELIRVDHIMPYAVKAGGKGGYGSEKRISHPNGEGGIFLSQCLSGSNGIAIHAAYAFPENKL